MGVPTYTVPTANADTSTEEPKIITALTQIKSILNAGIDNANIATGAAIDYAKLALTNQIRNGDIYSAAAIAYSKLNLAASIVNADIASGAAIAFDKLAALSSAKILVGNGSNVATAVTPSGSVALDNTGKFTLTKYAKPQGSNTNLNIDNASYVDIDNLSVTPAAGTYLVIAHLRITGTIIGSAARIAYGLVPFTTSARSYTATSVTEETHSLLEADLVCDGSTTVHVQAVTSAVSGTPVATDGALYLIRVA